MSQSLLERNRRRRQQFALLMADGCLVEVDADDVRYPFEINVEAEQAGASAQATAAIVQ